MSKAETVMIEQPPRTDLPPSWSRQAGPPRWDRDVTPLHRFLGGSPIAVLIKLVLVSLIVGAVLMWLNISPAAVFRMLSDLANRIYALGFDALREFGTYIVAGAAIVVPVWLVVRVLSFRSMR